MVGSSCRRDPQKRIRRQRVYQEPRVGVELWSRQCGAAASTVLGRSVGRGRVLGEIHADFESPSFLEKSQDVYFNALDSDTQFRTWVERNVNPHKHPSYASVTISLKGHGNTPGDASASQMRVMADLAERFGHEELRVSHEQNIVVPHVAQADLPEIYRQLGKHGLATANIGLVSDIIACPGMDYCALATARSIPIAQDIALRYERRESEIGDLKIKISGCINACGHHHVGHIGILGLDKAGVENYQITIGLSLIHI